MESLQQIKGEIPSLKDICVKKAIEKGDFSPEKILDWWDFAGSFGNKGIAEHVRSLLNTRYEYYLEKIGEIVLKERLGEDVYRELFERKELKMWRRSASFSGSIIDKPPAKDENGLVYGVDVPLCEFYPMECLQSHVKWPANVDPSRREMYLNDSNFVAVMGISRTEFLRLPLFKQILIKKEKDLF
eukprot:TRINITY_DN10891_c0_g1_i1.p1 TRINITY_DN10891_c0_g1~~TRINITY_DN10891_c0_g1_i1.p1  ORF type:complete len:186 (+),score=45.52 TRINITY_DN10891_c0_g1_i1:112-669(+)